MTQKELNTEMCETNEFDDYDELSQQCVSDNDSGYESGETEYDWSDEGYESEHNWIEYNNTNYV